MNRSEAAALLTLCAAFDRRTLGEADVMAWADVLADVNAHDAQQAVRDWYTRTRDWIMPSDVRDGVKKIRANRLERTPLPDPPPNVDANDPHAFLAWQRATTEAIADGTHTPTPRTLKPRDMRAINGAFQRIPS